MQEHGLTPAVQSGTLACTRGQRRTDARPESKGGPLSRPGHGSFVSNNAANRGGAKTFRALHLLKLRTAPLLQSFVRAAVLHEGRHNGAMLLVYRRRSPELFASSEAHRARRRSIPLRSRDGNSPR